MDQSDLALILEDFLLPPPLHLQREADEDVAEEDEEEGNEEDDAEDEPSREETLGSEWSTLIGRGPSRYCVLIGAATPALLCHKDTAQGTQSPLLGPFLAFRCVYMAKVNYNISDQSEQSISGPMRVEHSTSYKTSQTRSMRGRRTRAPVRTVLVMLRRLQGI